MLRGAAVVAFGCLGLAAASAAGNTARLEELRQQFGPPVMIVARPAAPPTVDGKLDEAAWSAAQPVGLVYLNGRWDRPSQKTEARVLADEKAVYFAVKCFEANPGQIHAVGTTRDDDAIWNGDTVEFFLDVGHRQKRGQYVHIIVNPRSVLYDERDSDKAWNGAIDAKAGTFEGGWTVEMSVAMKGLVGGEAIPKVWGLNINRQRPEIGEVSSVKGLTSHAVKIQDPSKYREGEDTAWAPTWCTSSHIVQCFGHAVLEAGTREVRPPEKLFDLVYRNDFDEGKLDGFWNAEICETDNFRGPGKCIRPKGGKGAMGYAQPLTDVDDATILFALRLPENGRFYWYGRAPDDEQCDPDRHETFLTAEEATGRAFPALDDYDTHSSKMAWKIQGRLFPVPGPWKMMTGEFGEASIGSVIAPGRDWVIVRTRLGQLRRQRSQGMVPLSQNYPRGFTFADEQFRIDEFVIFRGRDLVAPDQVAGVAVKRDGDGLAITWDKAKDNTITAYYKVFADKELLAETHQLSTRIKPLFADKAGGKEITIVAVDLYENASRPSEPAKAPR